MLVSEIVPRLVSEAVFAQIDIAALDQDSLVEWTVNLEETLHEAQAEYDRIAEPTRKALAAARERIKGIIEANGGKALAHDTFIVELSQSTKREKRIDVLRQLESLLPAEELKKALYLSQPEPEWCAHAGKLDTLARKYGGEVARIVAEGTPTVAAGPSRLTIAPREKVVAAFDRAGRVSLA